VLGERALLEGGRRTATLRAVTPCRVATISGEELDPQMLSELADAHRREGD
jgi:CRP-like cAMP-binding protein